MKKLFSVIIMAAVATNFIEAQSAVNNLYATEKTQRPRFEQYSATNIPGSENVNPKVVKDFSKYCKDATNVYWDLKTDGTIVAYRIKGKKGNRYYDRKGNFICNVIFFDEEYLPANVKDQVKSTYYLDYHIISAEEIKTAYKEFYFVYIQNKEDWKKLKVCEGEIEIMQESF